MRFVHAMWRWDTPLAEYKLGSIRMCFTVFVKTQPRYRQWSCYKILTSYRVIVGPMNQIHISNIY